MDLPSGLGDYLANGFFTIVGLSILAGALIGFSIVAAAVWIFTKILGSKK